MRITEAAQRLGTSPRMLRYRDSLGLLPAVRDHRPYRPSPRKPPAPPAPQPPATAPAPQPPATAPAPQPPAVPPLPWPPATAPAPRPPATAPALHRQFDQHDLDAVALALAIERRYDITPAALAFGLRVLAEPALRAEVADLGRRIGRIQAPAARALDFEQERALRLLRLPNRPQPPRPSRP
jgi:MerR family transcriptional regulator, copper efflux regulator